MVADVYPVSEMQLPLRYLLGGKLSGGNRRAVQRGLCVRKLQTFFVKGFNVVMDMEKATRHFRDLPIGQSLLIKLDEARYV